MLVVCTLAQPKAHLWAYMQHVIREATGIVGTGMDGAQCMLLQQQLSLLWLVYGIEARWALWCSISGLFRCDK